MHRLVGGAAVHARRDQAAENGVAHLLLPVEIPVQAADVLRFTGQPLHAAGLIAPLLLRLTAQGLVLLPQRPQPPLQDLLHPLLKGLLAPALDQLLKLRGGAVRLPGLRRRHRRLFLFVMHGVPSLSANL